MNHQDSNEGQHEVEANIVEAMIGIPWVDDTILVKVPVDQVCLHRAMILVNLPYQLSGAKNEIEVAKDPASIPFPFDLQGNLAGPAGP